jgi:hypothetical protein
MKKYIIHALVFGALVFTPVFGQYNACAGSNKIADRAVRVEPARDASGEMLLDQEGQVIYQEVEYEVSRDDFGNAAGGNFDLATDGAFEGNTVAVLHLYTGEGFDFSLPKAALQEKGFSVFRWIDNPPSPEELREKLKDACQLWVISSNQRELNDAHAEVIKEFFESGKGLYIWGDNDPYYADANFLTQKIFGTTMNGDTYAAQTVGISGENGKLAGIVDGHLVATGVEHVYEGITVATVQPTQDLSGLIYGSDNNLVTAIYEKDGKRAIIDGGFTRLFIGWDTAGTGRYVKNAAAWLVNFERFGELVLNEKGN